MAPMPAVIMNGPKGRERFSLAERTDIGRSPECDVVLNDTSISRRHATIHRVGDGYRLADLGSRFGTFVNETALKAPVLLEHGDQLRFGNVPLTFEDETT